MTPILSETLAPPITATIGGFGWPSSVVEDLQLLLDQEADRPALGRELLGDGDHRGLVPMAGAEGVVDVAVGQAGELLGERGVALLLALVEADVLQHDDPARLQGARTSAWASGPTVSSAFLTGRPSSSCEPGGDLVHLEGGVGGGVAGGAAEVADQDQARRPGRGRGSGSARRPGSGGRRRRRRPWSAGTLKSTRTRTFLPLRSRSRIVCLANGVVLRSLGPKRPGSGRHAGRQAGRRPAARRRRGRRRRPSRRSDQSVASLAISSAVRQE